MCKGGMGSDLMIMCYLSFKYESNRSELEAVGLESPSEVGLELILHGLSAEILIEGAGPSPKGVLLVLVVVRLEVADESASHVCVVLTGSYRGEEH